MTKIFLIGAAAAALVAVPTLAQQRGDGAAISRAQVEAQVRDGFAQVDSNRDGFVTRAEAEASRQARKAERQGDRGERRAARFAMLDSNRDGSISRAEFLAPRARSGDRAERREARAERRGSRMERRGQRGIGFGARAFERLDADRDGRVSLAEATAQRLQRFDRIDSNRDGTISREERRAARGERRQRG